jgi:hypothetical protein
MTRPGITPWGEVIPIHGVRPMRGSHIASATGEPRETVQQYREREAFAEDSECVEDMLGEWSWESAIFGGVCGLFVGMMLTAGLAWVISEFVL